MGGDHLGGAAGVLAALHIFIRPCARRYAGLLDALALVHRTSLPGRTFPPLGSLRAIGLSHLRRPPRACLVPALRGVGGHGGPLALHLAVALFGLLGGGRRWLDAAGAWPVQGCT